MKKLVLLTSVAVLSFGIIGESRSDSPDPDEVANKKCTCSWSGANNKTLTITNCSVEGTFASCSDGSDHKSAENVIIGTGVTSIEDKAFYNASRLKSITIPEGVTSIGYGVFENASSLTSITIPDSVTSIGAGAFAGASSLTSITLPEGLTSIGDSAFYDASSLTSITIPEGVTSIETWAFYNASSLTSITIPDNINTAQWYDWAFSGIPEDAKIVCQGGLNTCYEKLAKYFTSATCPQSLKDVGKGNLCNCSRYCISPSRISEATSASQCSGKYTWDENSTPKCRHMTDTECNATSKYYYSDEKCQVLPKTQSACTGANIEWNATNNRCVNKNYTPSQEGSEFSEADCYNKGQVPYDNQCWDEYPFAKKRWTPAEANEWLHDGNDNFVVITFKK